ncbi:MAG: GNAT family N-acetyltransferase [Parvularculaceae bacterium]
MGRQVDVTVTYLRQTARPAFAPQPRPDMQIAILRASNPPVHFYRYLYDLIGRRWNWVSRRMLSDEDLDAIIKNPAVHLYVLYVEGVPAGMAEIDAGDAPVVDIRFFGLAPEFIGRGLSRFFLSNAIDLAWSLRPTEVRIETCTLDHPAALALYQKFGFTVFDQRMGRAELLAGQELCSS